MANTSIQEESYKLSCFEQERKWSIEFPTYSSSFVLCGDCHENQEAIPQKMYFGGHESVGKPLVAISNSPVISAPPVVSIICVEKLASAMYSGEGEYSGGHRGLSLFSWYRETGDGTIILINEATLNLNAMNKLKTKKPWSLLFSFGRGTLQLLSVPSQLYPQLASSLQVGSHTREDQTYMPPISSLV